MDPGVLLKDPGSRPMFDVRTLAPGLPAVALRSARERVMFALLLCIAILVTGLRCSAQQLEIRAFEGKSG